MTVRLSLPASLVLAILASTAVSVGGAPAAEECLATPKGVALAGKHRYYSTNHATMRKCWFLAEADTFRAMAKPTRSRTQVATIPQDMSPSDVARAELVELNQDQHQLSRLTGRERNYR